MEQETKQPVEIKDLFGSRYNYQPVKSHRSERGDLISFFLEKINKGREGTIYKPLTIGRMGHLLSLYSTSELYILRMKCEKARNFVPTFWYYVNNIPNK